MESLESHETKQFINNYLNDLITQFNLEENIYTSYDDFDEIDNFISKVIINDKFELNIVKTKLQNGGALCGFHCLYNSLNFLNYLKYRDDKFKSKYYEKLLNSPVQFWKFYKNTLNYLLENPDVTTCDKKSLSEKGPLERYQFTLLLKSKPDIIKIINDDEDNEIRFLSYFFAFNFIQGMSKEDIISFQQSLDYFNNYDGKKRLIYIFLLGITNHWSVLIMENYKGHKELYYLDSTNLNMFHLKTNEGDDEQQHLTNRGNTITDIKLNQKEIEDFAEEFIQDVSRYRTAPTNWFKVCFIQWLSDINITLKNFFKFVYEGYYPSDIMMQSVLNRVVKTFEEYNHCVLDDEHQINLNDLENSAFEIKQKLIMWLKVEYHPRILFLDVLKAIEVYNYSEKLRHLKVYCKLRKWIEYSKIIQKFVHNPNWLTETQEKEDKEDEEIIDRYYEIVKDLLLVIN